ncbi:SEC-C domain-containing protein [Parabacteroides sp. OttesenSCG-928-B22]|nr:SEC-C domain-containing protein [Parabacteroides sp. OttesenSCG-928-B22]
MVTVVSPKKGFTGIVAKKTGRNELCECGSGRKSKKCCGSETQYYSRQKAAVEDDEARKRRIDGVKS